MRESIGSMWILSLVLTFVLIFSAFLVLMINYSNVFSFKNEVTSILEKYEGYTSKSRKIIDNYLNTSGYKTKGDCPDGFYSATSLDGDGSLNTTKDAYYCLYRDGSKYEIILFYKFNLPIIGDLVNFTIKGETNKIKFYNSVDYVY